MNSSFEGLTLFQIFIYLNMLTIGFMAFSQLYLSCLLISFLKIDFLLSRTILVY